uniref:Uncharacterized protein n=1 Tax=Lotus japonicus TaxID=34305 RepID=I3S3G4_LOTJA|nr:unknown [Lotus japonicus]
MPHSQRTRTHKQSNFRSCKFPCSVTEDVNTFQRHKHQRQNTANCGYPQVRST